MTIGSIGVSGIMGGNVLLPSVGSTGGGILGSLTSEPPPPLEGTPLLIGITDWGQVGGAVVGPITAPVIGSMAILTTFPDRFKLVVLGFV
jgi:hypothetical protein